MNHQQLIEQYFNDHGRGDGNLRRALEHIDKDEPEDAKVAILNAFGYTERNQSTFEQMANLVYVLLKALVAVAGDLPPPLEGSYASPNSRYATLADYLKQRIDPQLDEENDEDEDIADTESDSDDILF